MKHVAPICAVLAALASSGTANAQSVEEFYRNKTVPVVIGYPPGGGFDTGARLLIRHMGKHIPGRPNLLPRNMPGAASLIAANHLYNVAAKDGSEFGLMGGTVPFGALWSRDGVKFDATKFNWLGSIQPWVGVVLLRTDSAAKTYEQAKSVQVTVGATGGGDVTVIYPAVLNALTGTKFNVVSGYQGSGDLNLAIERNEVGGRLGWSWDSVKFEKPGWFSNNIVRPLAQLTFGKHPDLKDVPSLDDMTSDPAALQIMRLVFSGQRMALPFTLPPGVPADRVQALREAFAKTMADPEFLADAKTANFVVDPTTWQDMQKLIADAYATPTPVVERATKIIMGN